jgi:methyltransferase-like protein
MDPPDPGRCTALELGCGNGSNLLAAAYNSPESRFVGIDLSNIHIDEAIEGAKALGLDNVSFIRGDVLDFENFSLGKFDYIVAHGLYSWVPENVRSQILNIYRSSLSAQGVGYISYNVYPGCHVREMVWDFMRFHTAKIGSWEDKVSAAIEATNAVSRTAEQNGIYQRIFREEYDEILKRPRENVFHDDLTQINQPFYFHQFADQLRSNGLQFLSEADPVANNLDALSARQREIVEKWGTDTVRREQYIDFLEGRRFRASLVCRENIELDRSMSPEIIRKFFVSADMTPEGRSVDLKRGVPVRFTAVQGSSVQLDNPLTKAAALYLRSIWCRGVAFDELIRRGTELLDSQNEPFTQVDVDETAEYLLRLYRANMVKLHKYQPAFATEISGTPHISDMARWQIRHGMEYVTTLAGLTVGAQDEVVVGMVELFDGTRNIDTVQSELLRRIVVPNKERHTFKRNLSGVLQTYLKKFAEIGLLVK